jgi:hypothetical protein
VQDCAQNCLAEALRVASLASKDGLLATIGAASINPAAVPGHSKLADHEDVL